MAKYSRAYFVNLDDGGRVMMTKVLVVEDEAAIREEIVDMLRLDGYDVVEARDGEVAIGLAREELPDLVISDIMMPNIDGFELFHILKEDSQTANIPFIFLSALAAYDDVRQGMEMGADDYLTKPFDFHQLINAVQARLRKHADEEFHRFRQLAGQLISHHDDERAEIARELQERVLASLSGLYLLQESVNDEGGADQRIWEGQLNAVIRETQAVINRLQPMLLQQMSIGGILQWLALHHEKRHGLKVSLQLPEQELRATAEAQRVIYQVAEEALANCARHAQTVSVRIVVQSLPDACRIEITDRGVGFALSVLPESVGLLRVREKARLIGASVRVASAPGHGTRVTLHLPQQALANRPDPTLPKAAGTINSTHNSNNQGVRIVIAEDHEVIAEGLAAVVRSLAGFSVVASVQTTAQLFDAVATHEPEIVIVDAVLERATGLEAVYALKV
ncbi:MAG: response regulator, partial [Anaerolineales bacterium]|nr:response regulator [Anaerolineales bacterium]